MRHLKQGRKLGRNASHRAALMRNLACSLISCERIVTTVPKAKELRRFLERLITQAKKGTLHARRLVLARLGGKKEIVRTLDKEKEEPVLVTNKLFADLAVRYKDRPGGYTRIIKRSKVRLGDAGATCFMELVGADEHREKKPAPAPQVAAGETKDRG